ncbi:MAG: hypothetical protein H6538_03750 [Bacteroidales bacterium]|nr:hypothetical protein [Bacteroidales bacterium]
MENNLNKLLAEFVNYNFKKLKLFEIVSIGITILGTILFFLRIQNMNFIFLVGIVLTALCYFLLAYRDIEIDGSEYNTIFKSKDYIIFTYKLIFISLAATYISLIWIVYELNHTANFIAGIFLVVSVILSFFSCHKEHKKVFNIYLYLRVVFCLAIFISLLVYNS